MKEGLGADAPPDARVHFEETQFGFRYGAAEIERTLTHRGNVLVRISTPRHKDGDSVHLWITPSGVVRVSCRGSYWSPPPKRKRRVKE